MRHQQSEFNIKNVTEIEIDFANKQAVIYCNTEDGMTLLLKTKYATLEKIHEELRRKLGS